MNTQRVEGHMPITKLPWQSYWRIDEDGHANCGIFSETIKGHAYSVCRAPKYQTKEQWEADSAFILHACNNIERLEKVNEALVRALESDYRVYKDGTSWCAVGPSFTNLQESEAGFGDSPLEALGDLIVKEGV